MARPLRIQFEGAFYHVMSRGNARDAIFLDDGDRRAFLSLLWKTSERMDWWLWAYCLMGNHYHLLLETRQANLALGMRELNGVYSQQFNFRHERVGHLFQGRYAALVVDKDSYHLELSRYIVLNPVRGGLCQRPDQWPWSSYRAVVGTAPVPMRLAVRSLLSGFAGTGPSARVRYANFVRAGIGLPSPSAGQSGTTLGDATFAAQVMNQVADVSPEVARRDRTRKSLDLYERESATRDEAIRAAYASGAYSLVALGRHFGLHYSTVSRIVGRRQCCNSRPDPTDALSHPP